MHNMPMSLSIDTLDDVFFSLQITSAVEMLLKKIANELIVSGNAHCNRKGFSF